MTVQKQRTGFRLTFAAATAALLAAAGAKAQPAPQNTTVHVNYVYAASLGFGGYSLAGLSASVYTLPLSETLENLPSNGWALKLLLPIQGGLYNFNASFENQNISISQQSLSLVPGAELQIPVADRFVVKPFAQGGVGYSFGTGGGNPGSWIYLAGVRSVAQWQVADYTFSLGNGIIYAGDNTIGSGFGEDYVSFAGWRRGSPSRWTQVRRLHSRRWALCGRVLLSGTLDVLALPRATPADQQPDRGGLFSRLSRAS